MVTLTDYLRLYQASNETLFSGTTPIVGELIETDFSAVGNDVLVNHYEISFWCEAPSDCIISLEVNFVDLTKTTENTTETGWKEFYYDKEISSYQFTITGTESNATGSVWLSNISAIVYFLYTVEERKTLAYALQNTSFNGVDDYVDTNIKLIDMKANWILYVDFTSNNADDKVTLLHCMHEAEPWYGIAIDNSYSTNGRLAINVPHEDIFTNAFSGNRNKIAIRKSGYHYDYIVSNGEIINFDWDLTYSPITETLIIGALQDVEKNKSDYWGGTIHDFKLWSGYMSDTEFSALMQDVPTITIGTPSRTKISAVSGHDQATVTFTSDVALSEWEARATTSGQAVGHGSGLLVESGGILEANTEATVTIDNEELTNGDVEYTISIFGQSVEGRWSDG